MHRLAVVPVALLLATSASAASRPFSAAELIAAGKRATIGEIDYQRADCNDTRTLEAWLTETVGPNAKSIRWGGGACVLAVKENPRDAGTKYCAHAVITPKRGRHTATVETYFDPKGGKLGKAFAFRGMVHTKDGPDYSRETSSFEYNWRETYTDVQPPKSDNACN